MFFSTDEKYPPLRLLNIMLNGAQRKDLRKKPTLLSLIGAKITSYWDYFWGLDILSNPILQISALCLLVLLALVLCLVS